MKLTDLFPQASISKSSSKSKKSKKVPIENIPLTKSININTHCYQAVRVDRWLDENIPNWKSLTPAELKSIIISNWKSKKIVAYKYIQNQNPIQNLQITYIIIQTQLQQQNLQQQQLNKIVNNISALLSKCRDKKERDELKQKLISEINKI